MELLEGIFSRQSIRHFTPEEVASESVRKILQSALQAPSGLNNQPWRFIVLRDIRVRRELARLTKYSRIIEEAPVCLAVFLARELSYHETKDCQAIGACIQNMLLAAHGLGLGAVWLGEILKNAEEVRVLLEASEGNDLMAIVALGHPERLQKKKEKKALEEVLIREI